MFEDGEFIKVTTEREALMLVPQINYFETENSRHKQGCES